MDKLTAAPYLSQARTIVECCLKAEIILLSRRVTAVMEVRRRSYQVYHTPASALQLTNAADWSRVLEQVGAMAPHTYWPHLSRLVDVVTALEAGLLVGWVAK